MRKFETGAMRDDCADKLDFEGFMSPIVELSFAEYMHKHRVQTDGELRDSDNWQKGIPFEQYLKSLFRHLVDVWLITRGEHGLAREDLESALCAMKFNINGLLYEYLNGRGPRDG
jgi:hypothetical protein